MSDLGEMLERYPMMPTGPEVTWADIPGLPVEPEPVDPVDSLIGKIQANLCEAWRDLESVRRQLHGGQ